MPYHPNAPSVEEIYEELRTAADNGQEIILLHYNITYEGMDDDSNRQTLTNLSRNFDGQIHNILTYYQNGYDDEDFQGTALYKFLSEGDRIHEIIEEWTAEEN